MLSKDSKSTKRLKIDSFTSIKS